MAADRVGRRLGHASPARSTGLSPGGSRAERTASPGIQRRQARVTVKYDRRELQRRLDTEKWIDGRLEDLYRGREDEMPDEVNIDDLLEMDTDEERAKKLQGTLESCHNNTEVGVPFLSTGSCGMCMSAKGGVGFPKEMPHFQLLWNS
uniref:Protein phosphatase 1 regulatory inhibitor subunit 14A n=1 Tax=Naja naja TaxID=35670 RepID=A0A8C6YEQ7_NAJNA